MILRRRQPLIAALSIALLAIDALAGALGHSHGNPLAKCEEHTSCGHGVACCSHHDHPAAGPPAEPPPPADSTPVPDDDCSLCRHFSQPVLLAPIKIELVGSERVEPFEPALVQRIAT